jgi:hypothetical protein
MKFVKSAVVAVVVCGALAVTARTAEAQTARVVRVQQYHNQMRDGKKGMVIQLDLEVDGCQGQTVNVGAFLEWKTGKKVLALPGKYSTPDGFLSTQRKVVPSGVITDINNLELFLPYNELSLNLPGNYDFRFVVEVARHTGSGWSLMTVTPPYHFNLKQN